MPVHYLASSMHLNLLNYDNHWLANTLLISRLASYIITWKLIKYSLLKCFKHLRTRNLGPLLLWPGP